MKHQIYITIIPRLRILIRRKFGKSISQPSHSINTDYVANDWRVQNIIVVFNV
jgi:hypothetical protein